MHRQFFKATMISLVTLSLGFTGCGKSDDTPKQSVPVAKKIISQQKAAGQGEEQKNVQKDTGPQTATAPPPAGEEKSPAGSQTEGATGKSATAMVEDSPTLELYNPAGKLDPFAPLFKEEQVVTEDKSPTKKKRRGHLTPLEKVDLSQLVLLGTILAPSGNRAMVADTSGKGYVITIGTYIGMSSGRVVDILKDRIVVEEEVENILGKISLRKRELKIQKPLGE